MTFSYFGAGRLDSNQYRKAYETFALPLCYAGNSLFPPFPTTWKGLVELLGPLGWVCPCMKVSAFSHSHPLRSDGLSLRTGNSLAGLVRAEGIEPSASRFQGENSTSELHPDTTAFRVTGWLSSVAGGPCQQSSGVLRPVQPAHELLSDFNHRTGRFVVRIKLIPTSLR